jgi:hypothetical protein
VFVFSFQFPASHAAACLVHYLRSQKVTSPRSAVLNGCRPGQVLEFVTAATRVAEPSADLERSGSRPAGAHTLIDE